MCGKLWCLIIKRICIRFYLPLQCTVWVKFELLYVFSVEMKYNHHINQKIMFNARIFQTIKVYTFCPFRYWIPLETHPSYCYARLLASLPPGPWPASLRRTKENYLGSLPLYFTMSDIVHVYWRLGPKYKIISSRNVNYLKNFRTISLRSIYFSVIIITIFVPLP